MTKNMHSDWTSMNSSGHPWNLSAYFVKPNSLAEANEHCFIKFAHLARREFSDGNVARTRLSLLQIVFGDGVDRLEQELLLQNVRVSNKRKGVF